MGSEINASNDLFGLRKINPVNNLHILDWTENTAVIECVCCITVLLDPHYMLTGRGGGDLSARWTFLVTSIYQSSRNFAKVGHKVA